MSEPPAKKRAAKKSSPAKPTPSKATKKKSAPKKASPPKPTPSTAKKLMATSGNQCSFEGCTEPIVDAEHNTLVGEIAHIKGEAPNAKRYDRKQTDEQRRAYENLIVMCVKHHKIIDDRDDIYTVEKLRHMKVEHEARVAKELDRTWMCPPNQVLWMYPGGKFSASFWIDRSGRRRIHSDGQLDVLNRLFRLQQDLQSYSGLILALESMQQEPIVQSLLQQSCAKVDRGLTDTGEPYTPFAHVLRMMAAAPDITFRDFIQFAIQETDGQKTSRVIAAVAEDLAKAKRKGPFGKL